MEIIVAIITLVVGLVAEATIGVHWNMPGVGTILATSIMGAVILWAVRHPKNK